ncbi:hypothetical protein SPRG_09740 [Saprolegnia parasitica CBS 223.65]|uniref:Uncharacterized protein n=1 Tax=Saprolegnia parasitica (strain CBS 223.65) TaxID=695850 RepID=A0A067C768_SAPPC|nr:hypothetical protein SPRG_09740 [Saprolegnia parasitica CBS 223.65]KDO25010.1 hypothetical protein SPRG_09740 [Saprolegnia parasitica CBS 223.65]|eukprot:XP_012204279.1 hypothetical protein SPRG_09740 [Saprolegnia parasitica CBS 223.65]
MEKDVGLYLPKLVVIALRGGRLCIVQDLVGQGIIPAFKASHMQLAVIPGNTHLVAFLLANSSCSEMAEMFEQAATQNQFELLQWLHTTSCSKI